MFVIYCGSNSAVYYLWGLMMSEKRFTTKGIIISNYGVWDTDDKPYANDDVVDLLNELYEEKEDWKNNCLKTVSENSILWNEILILREQGAEPSDDFKNYLNSLKNKIKKLQEDLE